jgi:hypothetical protein
MSEQLPSPCPSKTCGFKKLNRPGCADLRKVTNPDDLPCEGVFSDIQGLTKGYDRSSEGPLAKPKNKEGELSLEELKARQRRLQEAVDNRVDEKGERVTKGVPPCEDALGRPIDRFGRPKR